VTGHLPVLRAEVLAFLRPGPGGRYLDATVGLGGHAEAILQASQPSGTLLGVDRDAGALAIARERLAPFGPRVRLLQGRYEELTQLVEAGSVFDGVLFDLGASSCNWTRPSAASPSARGTLDMRMDQSAGRRRPISWPAAGERVGRPDLPLGESGGPAESAGLS
jgi:16S rRNA (cytosine1402-N4)-methyltransferase